MSKTIYKNILQNMDEGVLSVDLQGTIITFNPASEKILSLEANQVLGKKFAEIFIILENVDEFNQVILDTILSSKRISNKLINITVNNQNKILNVTTSFLFNDNGEKEGVIVVFSDVTEIEELKLSEKKLHEQLSEEHKKLQKAYLELQEKTESLKEITGKLNKFKFIGVLFIFAIFLGLVYIVIKNTSPKKRFFVENRVKTNQKNSFAIAQSMPILNTIGYSGTISPLKTVNIVAPYSGQIQKLFVKFGNSVSKGQLLCTIDDSEIMTKIREAEINYIKQKNEYEKLINWDKSPEVAAAKRQLLMAQKNFQDAKNEFEITKHLYQKGIIPKTELNSAMRNLESTKDSLESAKENLKNVLNVASKDNLKIAKIQLQLLKKNLDKLKKSKAKGNIKSPKDGVLLPILSSDNKKQQAIDEGTYVKEGDVLFNIGDLSGFSIEINIDESDISKVKMGMDVEVIIDSIGSEHILKGKINSLSLVPSNSDSANSVSSYKTIIELKNIPLNIKKKILLGMSARAQIIIYKNDSAVVVPVYCIAEENGKFYVFKNVNGKIVKTKVKIGKTSEEWVEILEGLKSGDKVKKL